MVYKSVISNLRIAVNSVKKEKVAEAEEDVRVWSHLFK